MACRPLCEFPPLAIQEPAIVDRRRNLPSLRGKALQLIQRLLNGRLGGMARALFELLQAYRFAATISGLLHCGDGFSIGHQRLERKRLLSGNTRQQETESIRHGQSHGRQYNGCFFFDVPVNPGASGGLKIAQNGRYETRYSTGRFSS